MNNICEMVLPLLILLHTYIGADVEIGQDTVIYPGTMITGKTMIGADCEIGPNT